jgi:hypothetical protein
MEPTRSPPRKKMKHVSYKPVLRLDCTVSPGPQPILCLSALRFSIDSSSSSTGSFYYSASSYEHQSYSQESYSQQLHSQQPPGLHPQNYHSPYDHPPYFQSLNYQSLDYQHSTNYKHSSNYQPPNYQTLNYQSTPLWEECVGRYQPASNANFMDMCQTSSIYSSFSNRGGSFKDIPYAASMYAPTPLPEKNRDDCEAIFRTVSKCLTSVKEALATGQRTIDELIQLAPLLRADYSG